MDMDTETKISEFQGFLMDAYADYQQKTKTWRPSLNNFAKWLGVSPASLDNWLNGTRLPDLPNAIKLSKRLGGRVFEILGYPYLTEINDKRLRFIVETWEVLDDATIERIIETARGTDAGGS